VTEFVSECLNIDSPTEKLIYGVVLLIYHTYGETAGKPTHPEILQVLGHKGVIIFKKIFDGSNISNRKKFFNDTEI
jgi:hypothetical protein